MYKDKEVNKNVKNIFLSMYRNDPDLVQAFLRKWWVESDFKAHNPPLSLRLKGSGCHYNSMYNNTPSQGHYGFHSFPVVD
jgi:hypothetical protein